MEKVQSFKSSITASNILVFYVYFLLILFFLSGVYQKLYENAEDRVNLHAVPVAISILYQGHKHDYCGWRSTELPFQSCGKLTNSFLTHQINAPVDKSQGDYYWVVDDKGFVDYVIAAFSIFGPRKESLYCFWFLILFLSVTLFVKSFRKQIWAIAILIFLLLGMHFATSLLKLATIPIAIYEPRYLDVLALISIYHMVFFAVFFEKDDWKRNLYPFLGQLLIFLFLYHARVTLLWGALAIACISFFVFIARKEWKRIGSSAVVIMSVIVGFLLLEGYKRCTYNEKYFQNEGGPRLCWHNALMGLDISSMKRYAATEALIDDHLIAQLVIRYAKGLSSCPDSLKNLDDRKLLNSLGNWGEADWTSYERYARKLYFDCLSKNKKEAFLLYFFKKPLIVLNRLVIVRPDVCSSENKGWHEILLNPFNIIYLSFFIVLILSSQALYACRFKLILVSMGVFFFSMIPSIVFYSGILTQGGAYVNIIMLLYLVTVLFLLSFKRVQDFIFSLRGFFCRQ